MRFFNLNFYLKIIFQFIFISSFLISQSQIGSNISNKSETLSMSADGKITAVSDGTSSKVYSWNGSTWNLRATINKNATSVDISYDGNTIIIGEPSTNLAQVYQWNGTNDQGEIVSGGVYIFKISAGT